MAEWCIPFLVTLTLTLTSGLILSFLCLEHISYITANFLQMCLMLDQFLLGHSSRDCDISCSYSSTKTYNVGTQKNRLDEYSFEHPKHMFKLMDKKISAILRKLFLLNWPYALVLISEKRRNRSSCCRNLYYPLVMLVLLAFTVSILTLHAG